MRKRILLPALVLAGLAAGVIARQYFKQQRVTFTAVDIENHYDAAGNPKALFFETYSVWPDGSTEEIRHAVDGRPIGMRKIEDLTRRMMTVLDTQTSSRTSYVLTASEVKRARARPVCSSECPAGTLLGYSVVAETTARRYGDNGAVTTKKLAPTLDCFPLYDSTVRAEPKMITRIIVRFNGFPGRYVWHCHVLEHEDNDMMRPYDVIAATPAPA